QDVPIARTFDKDPFSLAYIYHSHFHPAIECLPISKKYDPGKQKYRYKNFLFPSGYTEKYKNYDQKIQCRLPQGRTSCNYPCKRKFQHNLTVPFIEGQHRLC